MAAGIEQCGPYHLRHTFAIDAMAGGLSIFELSRVMGASVKTIDDTYGQLARDSEEAIRARLNARSQRGGVFWRRARSDPAAVHLQKVSGLQVVRPMGRIGLVPLN